MEIKQIPVGQFQANAYILILEGSVLIIDPGAKTEKLSAQVPEHAKVEGILLTHGHFDHIGAVNDLVKLYQCPVYASEYERDIYTDAANNYSSTKKVSLQGEVKDFPPTLDLGPFHVNIHETPGHTHGSVVIQIGEHLFTGDTLFRLGIGRTDLYSGNAQDMKRSLQYLRTLPEHWVIHPGHEESSTLGVEFKENPYFRR